MTEPFLEKVKLSLPVGLWIENCLSSGIPAAQLINFIHHKDFATIVSKVDDPNMDMLNRLHIATEMNDPWERAMIEGYRFKFIHIGGVKRLLKLRFQLQEHTDYSQHENRLSGLRLTSDQKDMLEERIGIQWEMVAELQTDSYSTTIQIRLKNESC